MGRNLTLVEQQNLVKESGGNLSRMKDTVVSLLMEYVRSKKRNFVWNEDSFGGVRVLEKYDEWRLYVGFASSGINLTVCHDGADPNIGFAYARRSFGDT